MLCCKKLVNDECCGSFGQIIPDMRKVPRRFTKIKYYNPISGKYEWIQNKEENEE